METNEIINQIQEIEEKAKRRAKRLTFIPLISAITLITVTSIYIYTANKSLDKIKKEYNKTHEENLRLKMRNDSIINTTKESTIILGEAASLISKFKDFIDKIPPPERNSAEARFYISFRMFEETIRGNYYDLSEKISQLPNITDKRTWFAIVSSSVSLEDLKMEAVKLQELFSKDQVAIYKLKSYYALVIKGNGTFTRAYRLTVDLNKNFETRGTYFNGLEDWGEDYLLN